MEKTRAIISSNLKSFAEFEYYFSVIEIAEESVNKKPDVTIDCCKSLIEGISKSVLIRLDNNYAENNELVERPSASRLFDKAIKLIAKFDNSIIGKETDFLQKSKDLVDTIIKIRNERGDISHGRFAPKSDEIISTSEFAVFVINLTDSILAYILKILFQIKIPKSNKFIYESKEMEAYNKWLDDNTEFPIKKAKYSQLLFENDIDEYESIYSDDYLTQLEAETEEKEDAIVEVEAKTTIEPKEKSAPIKKIKKLVNTFDEITFWSETTILKAEEFAKAENLETNELRNLISNYLFSDQRPLRDDVLKVMNEKPSLKDRGKTIESLTEKIITLANGLSVAKEKKEE